MTKNMLYTAVLSQLDLRYGYEDRISSSTLMSDAIKG